MASAANPLTMIQGGAGGGQTVPSAGGLPSMSINPLGSSVFNNLASNSPIVNTLPNVGSVGGLPTGIMGSGITQNAPGTAPGGFNPVTGTGMTTPTSGSGLDFTAMGDLQQTYGRGMGTAIGNVLQSLGTTTSSAEQLMLQPTMMAEQQGIANVQGTLAAQGYSPGSSAGAVGTANVEAQTNAAIAGEMGQIGLNEEGMLLNAMMGEGQAHGSDVSGWDVFGQVMSGIGNAAVGVGEASLLGGGGLIPKL